MGRPDDERFMAMALDLARAHPFTSPNPMVGAVIVRDGEVLGSGAHVKAGAAHAEIVALEDVDASGATAYVTLEPCSHHGRTPPCAPALVDAGITRVVVAMLDPDPRVSGDGVAQLRAAGIEVVEDVLRAEAALLNAPYIHHRRTGRPFVTLKLALTLDGRMSAPDGSARWISGDESRLSVHRRRSVVDAVMVGAGTVVADDPMLTARDVDAPRQPLRVVVDSSGRTPPSARMFDDPSPILIATTGRSSHEAHLGWKERGAEVAIFSGGDRVDLSDLLDLLGARDILEVYVEGGGEIATSLLRDGDVDRLELVYGPMLVGPGGAEIGDLGVLSMADASRFKTTDVRRLGDDVSVTLMREEF